MGMVWIVLKETTDFMSVVDQFRPSGALIEMRRAKRAGGVGEPLVG